MQMLSDLDVSRVQNQCPFQSAPLCRRIAANAVLGRGLINAVTAWLRASSAASA